MLTLGLDLSTQSLTAVLLERRGTGELFKRCEVSHPFNQWGSLYGLRADTLTLPASPQLPSALQAGQYDQPPGMFLRSLDALFQQLTSQPLSEVSCINISSQQHGHVYLNEAFESACNDLARAEGQGLEERFGHTFAYPRAPIWMTANTLEQVEQLRRTLGEEQVLRITGSAIPLRFSGLIMRWLGQHYPDCYRASCRVHLINSFLAAVLTGRADATLDWGSAAGTLLFDYHQKNWSSVLVQALAEGLPGGSKTFAALLPHCSSPLHVQGSIAGYFASRYGFDPSCQVLAGSGDNPQSKVCAEGDLLSMGSSFVLMAHPRGQRSFHPWANATYDGLGRPFSFVCRTNGALVWDEFRQQLSLTFEQQEQLLRQHPPASLPRVEWLPRAESFPPSPQSSHPIAARNPGDLVALIDTSLADMAQACEQVFGSSLGTLHLTGGPTRSPAIVDRVEYFWKRPVQLIGEAGAAYGAACAALHCQQKHSFPR